MTVYIHALEQGRRETRGWGTRGRGLCTRARGREGRGRRGLRRWRRRRRREGQRSFLASRLLNWLSRRETLLLPLLRASWSDHGLLLDSYLYWQRGSDWGRDLAYTQPVRRERDRMGRRRVLVEQLPRVGKVSRYDSRHSSRTVRALLHQLLDLRLRHSSPKTTSTHRTATKWTSNAEVSAASTAKTSAGQVVGLGS